MLYLAHESNLSKTKVLVTEFDMSNTKIFKTYMYCYVEKLRNELKAVLCDLTNLKPMSTFKCFSFLERHSERWLKRAGFFFKLLLFSYKLLHTLKDFHP